MTRKEQIIEILNNHKIIDAKRDNILVLYAKDVEIGFIADEILALPLDVPGDEEIREQFPFYDEGIDLISNLDCQMGAEWMRSEIIKRNTP